MNILKVKLFMFVMSVVLQVAYGQHHIRCLPKEREALLQFKAAIVDDFGMLSSWTTSDCCQWEGVRCTNLTAHIISLHLPAEYESISGRYISGEIHKSLMELRQLQYLNLSFNYFRESNIPEFLGSLTNLRYLDLSSCGFSGQIPTQISSLSHLKYLNLARNNYLEGSIPRELGNLSRLEYLRLSGNSFEGYIPSQLGNLSRLQYLDLRWNYFEGYIPSQLGNLSNLHQLYLGGDRSALKIVTSDQWLSNLNSLTHLYLDSISNFNNSPSWLRTIAKLPKLRELSLIECGLSDHFLLSFNPSNFNFSTSLSVLTLSDNSFMQPMVFQWVSNTTSLQELSLRNNKIKGSLPDLSVFSSLKILDLSSNQLTGKIPEGIRLPSHLEKLSIRSNSLEGGVPKSFGSTCTLKLLDLSSNKLNEDLTVIFNHLSGCFRYSLRELYLGQNKFNGTLPDFSIFSQLETLDLSLNQISGTLPNTLKLFPSLKRLYLDDNMLNGTISKDLRFPPELETLSLMSNSLKGVLTDSHFYNMTKLKSLILSDNSLTLEVSQNWGSTFHLDIIELRSCKLGPLFPKWLKKQNKLGYLDISNTGISGTVPKWFWTKFRLSYWQSIDISCNNLQGTIPNLPIENHYSSYDLNLASNQFEGHVPSFLRGSMLLDLSNNKFTNSFSFLCSSGVAESLYQLDLSNNKFFGQIPDCWTHFKSLAYLNMSHNKFSGDIPSSMGSLLQLQVLLLRNNNLTGKIPSILKNCTQLVMVDIAENRLSGSIPNWIGNKLSQLQILSLRSNYFCGSLPLQICYLKSIQLLDISQNNLSGEIPKCIKNFSSMARTTSLRDYRGHQYFVNTTYIRVYSYDLNAILMWKGSEQMFTDKGLSLLKSIDLSNNQLSGEIPKEIEGLFGLVSLNLSRNQLKGKIPSNVGELTSLEFLDLSQNQLVGSIPSSLAQIDRLTMLDLSHNYLSGKIPTGTQLQSFDASKYEDNVDLCGSPLKKLCIDGVARQETIVKIQEDDNLIFNREYYISMTIGFVISFWGIFGSILMIRSWRHAYFEFLSNLSDSLYVMTVVKVLKRLHTT